MSQYESDIEIMDNTPPPPTVEDIPIPQPPVVSKPLVFKPLATSTPPTAAHVVSMRPPVIYTPKRRMEVFDKYNGAMRTTYKANCSGSKVLNFYVSTTQKLEPLVAVARPGYIGVVLNSDQFENLCGLSKFMLDFFEPGQDHTFAHTDITGFTMTGSRKIRPLIKIEASLPHSGVHVPKMRVELGEQTIRYFCSNLDLYRLAMHRCVNFVNDVSDMFNRMLLKGVRDHEAPREMQVANIKKLRFEQMPNILYSDGFDSERCFYELRMFADAMYTLCYKPSMNRCEVEAENSSPQI
jgi:hypothetical protein